MWIRNGTNYRSILIPLFITPCKNVTEIPVQVLLFYVLDGNILLKIFPSFAGLVMSYRAFFLKTSLALLQETMLLSESYSAVFSFTARTVATISKWITVILSRELTGELTHGDGFSSSKRQRTMGEMWHCVTLNWKRSFWFIKKYQIPFKTIPKKYLGGL